MHEFLFLLHGISTDWVVLSLILCPFFCVDEYYFFFRCVSIILFTRWAVAGVPLNYSSSVQLLLLLVHRLAWLIFENSSSWLLIYFLFASSGKFISFLFGCAKFVGFLIRVCLYSWSQSLRFFYLLLLINVCIYIFVFCMYI